jgi:hypothetical protein
MIGVVLSVLGAVHFLWFLFLRLYSASISPCLPGLSLVTLVNPVVTLLPEMIYYVVFYCPLTKFLRCVIQTLPAPRLFVLGGWDISSSFTYIYEAFWTSESLLANGNPLKFRHYVLLQRNVRRRRGLEYSSKRPLLAHPLGAPWRWGALLCAQWAFPCLEIIEFLYLSVYRFYRQIIHKSWLLSHFWAQLLSLVSIVSIHRYWTTLHNCVAIPAYDQSHDARRECYCLADHQLSLRNTMLGPHQSVHC